LRDPPLDSVTEVPQIDDLLGDAAALAELLAVAGRASLAGQFDHLVDPDGGPGLPAVLDRLEPRVGPGEDLVPLVVKVGTLVDVVEAREVGVLCPEPMSANGGLLQVLGMDHRRGCRSSECSWPPSGGNPGQE